MEPRIKVHFVLVGDEFTKEYVSEKLGIEPSEFRTKDDWPEAIKNWPIHNPEIPDEYKPRTEWSITIEYEECRAVSIQLEKLIKMLEGKENVINQLRKELNLHICFVVIIEVEKEENLPEIHLYKESIEFIAKIGADCGFDLYVG